MVNKTSIGWTDLTVNPARVLLLDKPGGVPLDPQPGPWSSGVHCEKVGAPCAWCYAEELNERFGTGLEFKPGYRDRLRPFIDEKMLFSPLRRRTPSMIFPCSLTDLFLDLYPDEMVVRLVAMMVAARQHFFQPLTKRTVRMRALLNDEGFWRQVSDEAMRMSSLVRAETLRARWLFVADPENPIGPRNPPPNIMWGVSVGDNKALYTVADLIATPAALRNISYEPALEAVSFKRWLPAGKPARRPGGEHFIAEQYFMTKCERCGWIGSSELCHLSHNVDDADVVCPSCNEIFLCDDFERGIDQMIFGGGSRGKQRCDVDWARPVLGECRLARASFFFKQTGSNAFDRDVPIVLPRSDDAGEQLEHIPEDLRVREIPAAITAWLTREVRQ